MKKLIAPTLFAVLFLMSACAQLGLPTADTFNQKWAVAIATVTQVRTTSTQLLNAKKISSADDDNVQRQADNARAGLDVARNMSKTDLTGANNRLTMATAILTAAQAYLATRSP